MLKGKKVKMPKPFMIIKKNQQPDEDSMMDVDDEDHDSNDLDRVHVKKTHYVVKGLAYEKYLFKIRPQTIMKSAQYLVKS